MSRHRIQAESPRQRPAQESNPAGRRAEAAPGLFTGFGERGLSAERVGVAAADEAAEYLAAGVPVGRHLADQLLLPMALGGGGAFRTVRPSGHTRTHVELLRSFLGADHPGARRRRGGVADRGASATVRSRIARLEVWDGGPGAMNREAGTAWRGRLLRRQVM